MLAAVINVYDNLTKKGKPQSGNEFTVLASIVMEIGLTVAQREDDLHIVISLATGTRSAGCKELEDIDYIIKDSHAEVLAKRAFQLFLLDCVSLLRAQPDFEQDVLCPFAKSTADQTSCSYFVKEGYYFHLFISDSPCGDACIYPCTDHTVAFTGAKLISPADSHCNYHEPISTEMLSSNSSVPYLKEPGEQLIGGLRTKPGRSDILHRSASLSCSDKLVRWLMLGLQGKLLSTIVGKVGLSSISVGRDPASAASDQHDALRRALIERAEDLHDPTLTPALNIIDISNKFPYSKQVVTYNHSVLKAMEAVESGNKHTKKRRKKDITPCSTSINCLLDLSVYINCSNRQQLLVSGLPRKCYNDNVEVLVGSEGLPQGTTLTTNNQGKYSRLSRRAMRQKLDNMLNGYESALYLVDEAIDVSYNIWKQLINEKIERSCATSNKDYKQYKQAELKFFEHTLFKYWIRSSNKIISDGESKS